ncbi:hypothetical protein C479_14488 [Halovivax asiaticus JCM 14624]|uniref:Protein-glutamine gamma-glutamyltransferase-like C-terminal domain-containing protein n=1 Tax=Halovivax asiaticus JCM 14624 TaxID=1227490 RepID=M0BCM0_9EURY|nr:DUF4129 domain-containing protein [Halovivax asiaticus]ELZ08555.1 hypothetical protein C479_14488 [Halovivax asiaticus JCM 14624]
MRHGRVLLLAATLLSILSLGIAGSALEAVSISSPYEPPSAEGPDSGVSLFGMLFMLLAALFELFGIELTEPAVPAGTGDMTEIVVAVLEFLYPNVLVLLALGLGAVLLALAGHRLPDSSGVSLVRMVVKWGASALDGWRYEAGATPRHTDAGREWPPADPTDEVSRAWVAMTTELNVDNPRCRTPTEWRRAAVDAGIDPAVAREVTDLFRKVRYGRSTASSDDRHRANDQLRRIEGE